ncbi:MAG: hypothetical protein BHW56_00275 [Acetobacter sp. 46_36]|nr:MAG: hypothetical protein BHW56_00275 [Acetobacter sp. 46_36]
MDWMQILISSLSGIFGTIIGGFIAYLTMTKQFKYMAEQEIQKQRRDDELYLKRKRESLYAKMYDFLMRFEKDIRNGKDNWMSKQTKDLFNVIQVECIWGNKKTMDLFYDFFGDLFNSPSQYKKNFNKAHAKNNKKILDFQAHIRKELGIKD